MNAIIIKLFEGCHPERPESIHDAQWDFIMLCMNLVVESRPSAAEVVEWVKEAISMCEFPCFTLFDTSIFLLSFRGYKYRCSKHGTAANIMSIFSFAVKQLPAIDVWF